MVSSPTSRCKAAAPSSTRGSTTPRSSRSLRSAGFGDVRQKPDLVTPKLAPLHVYQLACAAPRRRAGSFDARPQRARQAAVRGQGRLRPLPRAAALHRAGLEHAPPEEIGIDSFQADRSPDGLTARRRSRACGPTPRAAIYHDGRFASLGAVVAHYDRTFSLGLTAAERRDLVEYLKSL